MNDASRELVATVRRHGRRRRSTQASALAMRLLGLFAAVLGVALAVLFGGLASADSLWLRIPVDLALVLLVALPLYRLLRPVRTTVEAKSLDDAMGLKDRLSSAVSFLSRDERTTFQSAAVADALQFLPQVEARRETGVSFRAPLVTLIVAVLASGALTGVAYVLRPDVAQNDALASNRDRAPDAGLPDSERRTPDDKPEAAADAELTEIKGTQLEEEDVASSYSALDLQDLASAAADSEADRLLAQAAYLDEADLSDSGLKTGDATGNDDRVTMKEPDMDMIREMVKEAQDRKKRGEDDAGEGDEIKLEVLIKTHAEGAGKRPATPPPGKSSSAGASGPSQDTRIKPMRVQVREKVAFKITSVRSLTPALPTVGKRVVLSEAIMRTSGVEQSYLVEPKTVPPRKPETRETQIVVQGVPAELRAIVSKYFEGLRRAEASP